MEKLNTHLASYYESRAKEYDKIYSKPERQEELITISEFIKKTFADKNVLEIACGTGYWTEKISSAAKSVTAVDINKSVIEIAEERTRKCKNINYVISDLFNFKTDVKYDILFGGFIWSHIPSETLDRFIKTVSNFIVPAGEAVFVDNNFVEGSSTPISQIDDNGNTYQRRELQDKSTHLVLKNFPSEEFLKNKLSKYTREIKIIPLQYYWILCYRI